MRVGRFIAIAVVFYACVASGATGRILKVLPQYLDKEGRHTLSPSLFERDAYQAHLRRHPELRHGMRFAIQWKVKGKPTSQLKLRLELRSVTACGLLQSTVLEKPIKPNRWFSRWTYVILGPEICRCIGEIQAWRVSLWDGDELVADQSSFLW